MHERPTISYHLLSNTISAQWWSKPRCVVQILDICTFLHIHVFIMFISFNALTLLHVSRDSQPSWHLKFFKVYRTKVGSTLYRTGGGFCYKHDDNFIFDLLQMCKPLICLLINIIINKNSKFKSENTSLYFDRGFLDSLKQLQKSEYLQEWPFSKNIWQIKNN